MKKYESYNKGSGIEWIGEIPIHWEISKFKYALSDILTGGTPDTSNDEYWGDENDIPWVSIADMTSNNKGIIKTRKTITDKGLLSKGLKIFPSNTLIYSIFGSIGKVNRLKIPCTIHQGILGLSTNSNLNTSFLEYYLLFQERIISFYSSSNTQENLNKEKVRNFIIPIPTNSEQSQIVEYLDHQTSLTDDLIAKKEKKIEFLKEKRTALINHAVTKGLNTNVEMDDRNITWLDSIPINWAVKKIRFLGEFQNGISKDSDSFGSGFPFLSYGDVYNNEILPTEVKGMVNSTEKERANCSVNEGDVFFTRTSETMEEIGISSTCMRTIENCVFSGFVIRFRNQSNLLIKEFSKYYFQSHFPRTFLVNEMDIVTRASLSQELLKRLPILLPPIQEQKEIAEYLDYQTQQIDFTIVKEKQKIDLLKEYRQSLISEVVTGKIDVRKN